VERRKVSRMANEITVALAGNPNFGKTTVFNNLSGTRQVYFSPTVDSLTPEYKIQARLCAACIWARLAGLSGRSMHSRLIRHRIPKQEVLHPGSELCS